MSRPVVREDPMQAVLARLREAATGETVSVREMVEATGNSSFSTLLFVVALLVVTPLSAIPTVPTIAAITIALVVGQWLAGRQHLWLPNWILRRSVDADKYRNSLDWALRSAIWVDRCTGARLEALLRRPLNRLPLLLNLLVVVPWPVLELLPLFTSVCGFGVALLAFGLMARDGLFVLLGYLWFALLAGGAILIL